MILRPLIPGLLVLALLGWAAPRALAQRDVLDNIILLGGIEDLKTPGISSTTHRPEEKAPGLGYKLSLEHNEFHRPKTGRSMHEPAGYLAPGLGDLAPSSPDTMQTFLEGSGPVHELQNLYRGLSGPQQMRKPLTPEPEGGLPGHEEPPPSADELLVVNLAGMPGGITLDAAIERVVHYNQELMALSQEISQADADVLTATLRENPLIFWDASGIPYGRFQNQPGTREYPIVLVFPVDLTGRRKARIRVAHEVKNVIQARYLDEVRQRIDDAQRLHLDLLTAAAEMQARQAGLRTLDRLLHEAQEGKIQLDESQRRTLRMEQNLTRMSLRQAYDEMRSYRVEFAALLDLPRDSAQTLEVFGRFRDVQTLPPPREALSKIALSCRPDLIAQRQSVQRSLAMHDLEKARQFRDTYFLYEPWSAQVETDKNNVTKTSNIYAIGLFVPLPLYDRNQGNVRRSSIEISKMQTELSALGREVLDEVAMADDQYHATLRDVIELERDVLPQVVKDRNEAWQRFRAGGISADEFLTSNRTYQSVARHYRDAVRRHRRAMLHLNTVVANRVVP